MTEKEKMRRLEEEILNSEIPEDKNYQGQINASTIAKNIKKKAKSHPQKAIGVGIVAITLIISVILLCNIIAITSKKPQQIGTTEQEPSAISGFDELIQSEQNSNVQDTQIPATNQIQDTLPQEPIPDTADTTQDTQEAQNIPLETVNDQNSTDNNIADDYTEPQTNKYFASQAIQSAAPEDSLVQIGETIYKIPVSLRELEENGIHLITLGTAPPSEDVMLSPSQRNGYIQFEQERYRVKLYNGQECNYHDLQVVGLYAENMNSASIYIFGGLTIGSEEASIPQQAATLIEMDYAKTHTFHYFGKLTEKTVWKTSGKRTSVITNNQTGKVDRIELFNDNTTD